MAYEVHFVLDGREAKVLEEFDTKRQARDCAVGLEECGAITDIEEV